MSGIAKHTGSWNFDTAKHLAKRTMFGATRTDVDYFLAKGLDTSVAELLTTETAPSPPVNNYSPAIPDPKVSYGSTWVNKPSFPVPATEIFLARKFSLKSWWIGQMLGQGRSVSQKMTLFWQNHFSIQLQTIPIPEAGYKYLNTLMQNCLGNIKSLTKLVTIDPAMLFYLNGYLNSASAPDENYARELQELFTVGKGPNSKYTEEDVKAAAKILTGYRINPQTAPVSYYFDATKHDFTAKKFSSFYNDTIINGTGQTELDALLDMIFSNNETALHIVRKLYIYFVYYKIDDTIETEVIEPLAAILRNNNYNINPVLDVLFKSEHFYDISSRSCIIKNPLDFMVGICKEFKVNFPVAPDHVNQYDMWNFIRTQAALLGMDVIDAPSVSGWPAYYQIPSFHELWVNSDTYARRNEFIDVLLNGFTKNGITLKADLTDFAASLPNPSDPVLLINDSIDLLLGLPLNQNAKNYYKNILLSGQSEDYYWTSAWNNYAKTPVNDPNYAQYKSIVQNRLLTFYGELLKQSEYQLS